jgi:hypothetical protein
LTLIPRVTQHSRQSVGLRAEEATHGYCEHIGRANPTYKLAHLVSDGLMGFVSRGLSVVVFGVIIDMVASPVESGEAWVDSRARAKRGLLSRQTKR